MLNCTGGDDFSTVLQGENDIFSLLFSNFHKWFESSVRYERGAWLHVYGIPVHAWNVTFLGYMYLVLVVFFMLMNALQIKQY